MLRLVAATSLLGGEAATLWGLDGLLVGTDGRAVSSLGVVGSRGPSATVTNPAALSLMPPTWAIAADLAVISASFQYEPPSSSPIKVGAVVPMPTLGAAGRFGSMFTAGLYWVPLGAGQEMGLEGMPLDVMGQQLRVDVKTSQTGYRLGGALAVRPIPMLALGLGLNYMTLSRSFSLAGAGSEDVVLESVGATSGVGVLLGGRLFLLNRKLQLAVVGAPSRVREVRGELGGALVGSTQPLSAKEFEPASWGVGAELRATSDLVLGAEYLHENWEEGAIEETYSSAGLNTVGTRFRNTHNFSGSARYRTATRHSVMGGLAWMPRNVHGGYVGEGNQGVKGIELGDFESLDRWSVSGGYRYHWGLFGDFGAVSLSWTSGQAEVEEGLTRPGRYSLSLIMLNLGCGLRF